MVYIPRDYVELDCREEGKVNLPEIHVTSDARGDWMELREAKLLQIIREMFGGMENCLYLCFPKNGKNMEAIAFSPYQMKVIGLMEHVKSDEQMKEIGNLLSDYFAQKAVQEADKLWDDKVLDCSTIEKWKNEHMRTPY